MIHQGLEPPAESRALIFDCDGTLAVTRHAHFEGLRQALAAQGFALAEAWYLGKTGLSLIETCHAFGADHGVTVVADEVRRIHARVFAGQIALVRPVTAVETVVRACHGIMPMAVASGGDVAIVERTLAQIGLRGFFEAVVGIGEITTGKPAPDLFLRAAELLRMRPGQCFVYEDSDEGLEAARRAGMRAVDVRQVAGVER